MSDSSSLRPWILALAALGGLGAGIWLLAPGRTDRSAVGRAVGPPSGRGVADERTASELIRPDEASAFTPGEAEDPVRERHPDWTPMRLVGRVEQAENERPLADVVVQVDGLDGPDRKGITGARTDEEGRFEIFGRAPEEITVRALPRRGFVTTRPPHVVSDEERAGQEEIVLVLARGTSAPVTGVVVNRRTQEGVFELRVDVTGGELSESVRTDGTGNFATEVAFPPGPVSAAVFDEPPDKPVGLGTFRREHLEDGRIGEPWALEIDIGPSFLLDSTSGAALGEGFTARIVETNPEPRFAAMLDVFPGGFQLDTGSWEEMISARDLSRRDRRAGKEAPRPAANLTPPSWPEIPVRSGPTPWIRYAKQFVEPPADDVPREITLHVRGAGQWIGEAEIPTTVGHYPYTVGVPLRACGQVGGVVIDTTGEPVKAARVLLYSRGGGRELALQETKTNDGGVYSFATVDVGLYRLVVEPELHAGETRLLRVEPGANVLPKILLPPAMIAGDVSGELFVAAETPHEQPFLTLASAEGSSWRRVEVARVAARDVHGTLYAFHFADVPTGEFDLSVGHIGIGDRRKGLSSFWTPRRVSVYPPRDGIRFECRAPDDPEALAFRVVDGAGEPVPHADVVFGPEGYLVGQYELRGNRVFFLPRGVPLQWTVCARGYRPVHGDASAARRDGELRVVEVTLRQGWGATLHVLAAPDAFRVNRRETSVYESKLYWQSTPVEARVYADGSFVGRTDARGRIDLSLSHMPQRIGIEKPGWTGAAVQELHRERDESTEAVLWLVDFERTLEKLGY